MRFILACLLVGCVAPTTDDAHRDGDHDEPSTPTTPGTPDQEPEPEPPQPAPLQTRDSYALRSQIDLTVEAILPQTAADAVVTLRSFSTAPAHTLLDLAEGAGVPAVQEIRDALPSYVEDKLEGWIDAEIAQLTWEGTPITQLAGEIAALAETSLAQVTLESELTIHSGAATHKLTTLDLTPAGLDARIPLGTLSAEIVSATPTCSVADPTLSIGDHGYSLAYGEYIWQALEQYAVTSWGVGIRAMVGEIVSCPRLATRISQKCAWDYCVGHQPQLNEICERGLDEVVAKAQSKVTAYRFEMLHLAQGSARLVDADGDRVAEALADGVWTAEINVGQGLRHAPATFVGR